MSATARIEHETRRRLRATVPGADLQAVRRRATALPGVRGVRVNARLDCVVVEHDGAVATRKALLGALGIREGAPRRRREVKEAAAATPATYWLPGALAAAVPLVPRDWQRHVAVATVIARVGSQPRELRRDPAAVVLDATSLAALASAGRTGVVATSVLLRIGAERISRRLVRQADQMLERLMPQEAAQYPVADPDGGEAWLPLPRIRPGDHLRLAAGDVVPVDGCVLEGTGRIHAAALDAPEHDVGPGDPVPAGARLEQGTVVLRAESDAGHSRLARMRAQLQQAMESRDPVGRLQPERQRLLALPLTASALVLGLTGDKARAAAMLQADPQKGLDLALPLAREAALYAVARHGMLARTLEAVERLATAQILVLQDTGVLATGRWAVGAVQPHRSGVSEEEVRRWVARMAHAPDAGAALSLPDRLVREWVRHGVVLVEGGRELHLVSPRRLESVWDQSMPAGAGPRPVSGRLQRVLVLLSAGKILATVFLASEVRPGASGQLRQLASLGFERIALFLEEDGQPNGSAVAPVLQGAPPLEVVAPLVRREWLAEASAGGGPLVLVHSTMRDLVPAGSLSLTPMDAEAGSHGMLLDDPLPSLVAARAAAAVVHRRLSVHQTASNVLNSVLMMSSALRWMPVMGNTLLHHGFALLLLLDSLRLEQISPRSTVPALAGQHRRT